MDESSILQAKMDKLYINWAANKDVYQAWIKCGY